MVARSDPSCRLASGRRNERQRPVRHQPFLRQPAEKIRQARPGGGTTARSPDRRGTRGRPAPPTPVARAASAASSSRCVEPPGSATRAARGGPPAPRRAPPPAAPPRPRTRTAARSTPSTPRPRSTRTGYALLGREQQRRVTDHEHGLVRQPRQRRRDPPPRRGPSRSGAARSTDGARSDRAAAPRCATTRCGAPCSRRARSTGRRENSATLCTGPSQVMARSGSRWYAAAFRAYSTADTTLTCSSPAASRSFSSDAVPVTSSAGTLTRPAIDRAVDRVAVDPRNATQPHAACTTGSAAPRRSVGSGGGSSNCSRTGW